MLTNNTFIEMSGNQCSRKRMSDRRAEAEAEAEGKRAREQARTPAEHASDHVLSLMADVVQEKREW